MTDIVFHDFAWLSINKLEFDDFAWLSKVRWTLCDEYLFEYFNIRIDIQMQEPILNIVRHG